MSNKSIDLYSLATPNGQKVSIALEEMELEYKPHTIDISEGEQFSAEFIKINPNSKIPAIVDHNGPHGKPITLMESGAILMYLAEKTNKLLPKDTAKRYDVMQWLFFQMGGVGPMFGQFGHFFKYAKDTCKDPYPLQRYTKEVHRLLTVLDKRLSTNDYMAGDEYSIADIAIFPWVGCLDWGYDAAHIFKLETFKYVKAWHDHCTSRPAAQRGAEVCKLSKEK